MCKLNSSQVLILKTLAAAGQRGLTQSQLEARADGAAVTPWNLGPVLRETLVNGNGEYSGSLYGLGYARPLQDESEGTKWVATAKGLKIAPMLSTLNRRARAERVPAPLLDRIVKLSRKTRTYGLELYTSTDMAEIRDQLGADYQDIPLGDLQLQICNRRKQGAYADPAIKTQKSVEKTIREFGPQGTVLAGFLTPKQIAQLHELLATQEV